MANSGKIASREILVITCFGRLVSCTANVYTPNMASGMILPPISRSLWRAKKVISVLMKIHLPKWYSSCTASRSHRKRTGTMTTTCPSMVRTSVPATAPATSAQTVGLISAHTIMTVVEVNWLPMSMTETYAAFMSRSSNVVVIDLQPPMSPVSATAGIMAARMGSS